MPSSGMGHGHRRTLSSASAADQLAYAASMASDDFGGLTRTPTYRCAVGCAGAGRALAALRWLLTPAHHGGQGRLLGRGPEAPLLPACRRAPSAAEGGLTSMPSAAMSASSPTHAAARR
jgi:hypothetical protein